MSNFFHVIRIWVISAAAAMFLPIVSCCPKVYPVATTDSVRVEIRDRVIHDSVYFEVEKQVEKIVTKDTLSVLENDWARSEASVSEGLLRHSLESIPRKIYVPYYVEVHDTTTIEKSAETIVVKENYITKWQSFQIIMGRILMLLVVAFLIYAAIALYLKSKGL